MNVKSLLDMPQWWCFAGDHQPIVRVGNGYIRLDFERVARDVRIGLQALVFFMGLGVYAFLQQGDWDILWQVALILSGFCGMMVLLLVSAMKSLAGASVYNALTVPLVRYDPQKIPTQHLLDIEASDKQAAALMREMLNMAWHVRVRWWRGFGSVADDILQRYRSEDIQDWLRRRELHAADVRALERMILQAG